MYRLERESAGPFTLRYITLRRVGESPRVSGRCISLPYTRIFYGGTLKIHRRAGQRLFPGPRNIRRGVELRSSYEKRELVLGPARGLSGP